MLIGKYIFVVFLSLFVTGNFRGACSSIEMVKSTYPEKDWEHLSQTLHLNLSDSDRL